jgi:hypothetical protein
MPKKILDKNKIEHFELRGKIYNAYLQNVNNFNKFSVDMVFDTPEGELAVSELKDTYGFRVHDELKYPETITGIKKVNFARRKQETGKYPCTSIPTTDAKSGESVTDYLENGADATIRVKVYGYDSPDFGKGNGFELESVTLHEWTK